MAAAHGSRARAALELRTKSVHSLALPEDGLRILIARFRGRGLPSSAYDVWMANLGPSEQLLRAYLGGKVSWAEYTKRYLAELFETGGVDARNVTIKNHGQKFTLRLLRELALHEPVTLLCHCAEDEMRCHRHVLERLLRSKRI
jgi:uncharacterized protein YeaO (DUF488 family)